MNKKAFEHTNEQTRYSYKLKCLYNELSLIILARRFLFLLLVNSVGFFLLFIKTSYVRDIKKSDTYIYLSFLPKKVARG